MNTVATNPEIPLTWLMLRTTGIVAIAILTLSTVIGIASPALRNPTRRLVAISIHTAASATGVILLVGHIIFAVADSYITISPAAVVVPGLSQWEPLWVGVGTVSLDLMLLIVLTSLNRIRAPRVWKRVHLLSYIALVLAWVHAMFAGTDATSRPMQVAAITSLAAVAIAIVFRRARAQRADVVVPRAVHNQAPSQETTPPQASQLVGADRGQS